MSAAAEGRLPDWAEVSSDRLGHMERVANLMSRWAESLGLEESERLRWRSVGYLHDALRDAAPESLRARVPPALRDLPGALLHGPAASERLRVDGVDDGELLRAVAFHTIGDAGLGLLGRALYAADFLEPGRRFLPDWRAELRERMPADLDDVVIEVARARVRTLIDRGQSVLPQTMEFWNALVRGRT